jgi:hypothetical protein
VSPAHTNPQKVSGHSWISWLVRFPVQPNG